VLAIIVVIKNTILNGISLLTNDYNIEIDSSNPQLIMYILSPFNNKTSGILFYIHGGGWIAGSVAGYLQEFSKLVSKYNYKVYLVDYTLSPTLRFPETLKNCYNYWKDICNNTKNYQNIPKIIVGDSAGGNISIGLTLYIIDKNKKYLPDKLIAISPPIDSSLTNSSYLKPDGSYLLSAKSMSFFWGCYLGNENIRERTNPYYSPFYATDNQLKDFPDTYFLEGDRDLLCQEGIDYLKYQ